MVFRYAEIDEKLSYKQLQDMPIEPEYSSLLIASTRL